MSVHYLLLFLFTQTNNPFFLSNRAARGCGIQKETVKPPFGTFDRLIDLFSKDVKKIFHIKPDFFWIFII